MKNKEKIWISVALCIFTLLTGCTGLPQGKKYDEGGSYLQSVYGDYVLIQFDYPSASMCSTELQATPWLLKSTDLKCSKVSNANELKYSGRIEFPIAGILMDSHFRTVEQCELYKKSIKSPQIVVKCLRFK
jgi:hypothetical protein